jgi:hypothetical protein
MNTIKSADTVQGSNGHDNKDTLLASFDTATYARTSDNNMPCMTEFVVLSKDEQREVDEALAL